MKRGAAIRAIKSAARANRVYLSRHAIDNDDAVLAEDIVHALASATSFTMQLNGRWRVSGIDRTGDPLTVVVLIDKDNVIAWTTF